MDLRDELIALFRAVVEALSAERLVHEACDSGASPRPAPGRGPRRRAGRAGLAHQALRRERLHDRAEQRDELAPQIHCPLAYTAGQPGPARFAAARHAHAGGLPQDPLSPPA